MEKTEKLVYKPGVTLEGIYKAYSPRFGFLITDDDHEDVYIGEDNHLNALNNDKVEVKTIKKAALPVSLKEQMIRLYARMKC
mgnify:CR=1 FL=1